MPENDSDITGGVPQASGNGAANAENVLDGVSSHGWPADEALRIWREVHRVIYGAAGEADALQAVCEALLTFAGCACSRIGLIDTDDPCVVRFTASAGRFHGALSERSFRIDGSVLADTLPLVHALETGEPVVSAVTSNTFFRRWFSLGDRRGFCAAFPLRTGLSRFGVLALVAADAAVFSGSRLRFWGDLADTVAHGIGAMRDRQARLLAERASRAADALLHAAIGSAPMLITVRNADGRLTRVLNGGQALPPGFTHQNMIGLFPSADGLPTPNGLDEHDRRIVSSGGQIQVERSVTGPDGVPRSVWTTRGPLLDSDGQAGGIYEIIRDISNEKEAAQRLLHVTRSRTVLSDLGQVLVRSDSEEALLAGACRALTEAGGYIQCWGVRIESENACRIRILAAGGEPARKETQPVQEKREWAAFPEPHKLARAIQGGLSEVCSGDTPPAAELCRPLGRVDSRVRACATMSLWDGATLYGALVVCAATDAAFSEEGIEFLRELSRDISFGITALRARLAHLAAEQKQHETSELLRNVIEGSSDFIYIVDFQGRYQQFLNRGGLKRYGIDPDRVIGRTPTQVWGVVIGRHEMERYQQILARGMVVQGEETVSVNDGGVRQLWVTNGPLRGEDGKLFGVFGIVRDVTDFRRAERVLRANSERLEVLQSLVARDYDNENDMIRFGMAEIMRITGSVIGYFNIVDGDKVNVFMQIRRGNEVEDAPFLPMGTVLPLPGTPWANCRATRKPLVVNNAAFSFGDGAGRLTLNRQICVPVSVNDRVEVLAGVCNKAADYEEIDVQQVSLFMESLWQLILHRRADQKSRLLRDQLEQSQKLELVGHLTGGIAHDFNNLLQVINGYSEIMLKRMQPGDAFRHEVSEIFEAGRRAAHMTGRLLAFSRRQVARQESVSLNPIILEMEKMLRRIIGENIDLRIDLHPDLPECLADINQIEQVLLNLCVNARDAMPRGGVLTLRTQVENLDAIQAAALRIRPGMTVVLAVVDTGTGMAQTVKDHLFEAFFTTKEQGKGTGLGLATVHGIITQHNGHIGYMSEVGVGTTCTVLLPAINALAVQSKPADVVAREGDSTGSGEWLLVGEDEDHVRKMLSQTLTAHGYHVLEACDGTDVLRLYGMNRGRVALIICDVCMPGKGGLELERELSVTYRNPPPVLFMTGYMDIIECLRADGSTIDPMVKPIAADELLRRVKDVLSRSIDD